MANFSHYPDDGIVELRYEDDIEYLIVAKKDWDEGRIFGFSTHYYSVARQYCNEHSDKEFIITLI